MVLGVRAGVALLCDIDPKSVLHASTIFIRIFPRDIDFQFDRPPCTGGHIHVEVDGVWTRYALERIHLEEDAGKLIHDGTRSLVDWNRGGTP